MRLNVGTRLGAYEITGPLGAGGMGEVYRARDTNLGRDVAIKVLPASFTNDATRVARFEREARTLASLNHPNIAHLYGLERGEGTTALVMEMVEGARRLSDRRSLSSRRPPWSPRPRAGSRPTGIGWHIRPTKPGVEKFT